MKKINPRLLSLANSFKKVVKSFPELRFVGDPILRTKTKKVNIKEAKIIGKKLGKILIKYRKLLGFGRGLAATQIGLCKSIFVTYIDKVEVFINPVITSRSKKTNYYKEVCLSSGIMAADVERSESIEMKWTDHNGVSHKSKFEGFLARLYQHEEAHLRGKINLDEASKHGIEIMLFDPLLEKLRSTKK